MTEEQFNKIISTPNYFKVSDQKDFEMTLGSCKLYHEDKKVCKSLRTEKNLCDDCWECAMDALAPWNQEPQQ